MSTPTGAPGSDQVVRDVLGALADRVTISPDAYHDVRAEWVRRQRRRKRLGILVAILLVVVADVVGLWALNRSDSGGAVIFDQHAPAEPDQAPVPRLGQP
jgi:hypothetical protein